MAFGAVVAFCGNASAMAIVGPGCETASIWIGAVALTVGVMYRWVEQLADLAANWRG